MTRAFNQRRASYKSVSGIILVLAMVLAFAITPSAHASTPKAAPVTVSTIAYLLEAQMVGGARAGSTVHGLLSGSMDSTGLVTATLSTAEIAPLMAGCAPHIEFGPACGLPPSANVSGMVLGGAASLTASGKGWSWVLAGGKAASAGSWAGTLTQGSNYVGSWALTPATTTVNINVAIKSDPKSKDKLVLAGAINLHSTLDGRAFGTFSPLDGSLPTVVQGWASADKSSISVSIPMGKTGYVLFTAWSRPGFGALHWNGTYVGPSNGDYGIVTGLG